MKLFALPRVSLRNSLLLVNALVAAALIGLSVQAWHAVKVQQLAQQRQIELAEAWHLSKQADMLYDALRADVLASLLIGQVTDLDPFEARQRVRDDGNALYETMHGLSKATLPAELRTQVRRTLDQAQSYALKAHQMVRTAIADRRAAMAELAAFNAQFLVARRGLEDQAQAVNDLLQVAQQQARSDADRSREVLLWVCAVTIVAATAVVALVTLAIRQRLRHLGEVAHAIADGDLGRRSAMVEAGELGELARAIDKMADDLSRVIGTMRVDARRAAFSKQLAEALDMADREDQVIGVAASAMSQLSADHAMELLLLDGSGTRFVRTTEHPLAGAPGCDVAAPSDCMAVRRGSPVGFERSDALNACSHLCNRACGTVTAVCVPVTFMGRAIGVLHAAGPQNVPLRAEHAQMLGDLGAQLGMRIGTVRSFQRSQIQASTDSLTGLANRGTLEQHLRALSAGANRFAVVMCDLDHFKMLNDTHGHAAGDAALRVFAEALRCTLRESDLMGRWGGEEFAVALVDADVAIAVDLVHRLRERLATLLQLAQGPRFTCSFGVVDSSMSRHTDQLIRLADIALYRAKAQGRDRACVADAAAAGELVLTRASGSAGEVYEPGRNVIADI